MIHFYKITAKGYNRWFVIAENDEGVLTSIKTYIPGKSITPAKLYPSNKTITENIEWAVNNDYKRVDI